jgi:hypothetical protein
MGTASTTPGAAVTPGASNAEGAWTQIATAANIANDVYGILLWVVSGSTSATIKDHLLDIGVDNAGGTTYTEKIANIVCGQSSAPMNGGMWFYFPFSIKAGSSVAVRVKGVAATAGSLRVGATFYGKPTDPSTVFAGQYSETIGTITNSAGVSFTPGNSNAEGTWVSLGTTTRMLWWHQLCVQVSNGTTTSLAYKIDLAYGDATNKTMIIENMDVLLPGTAEQTTIPNHNSMIEGFCEVPAGSTLYVRGTCSGTSATGWNAVCVSIGG